MLRSAANFYLPALQYEQCDALQFLAVWISRAYTFQQALYTDGTSQMMDTGNVISSVCMNTIQADATGAYLC